MKNFIYVFLGLLVLAIVVAGVMAPEQETGPITVTNSQEVTPETVSAVTKQEYSVLREWKPNNTNRVGFEVLYKPQELTQEGVETLIREIYQETNNEVQIVKIYLSEEAWTAEQKETYGPVYAEDYLAYVLYRENEIEVRWWQEVGSLAELTGQVTKLTVQ